MKKIIIAILLLIPILVILTIDASGKLIASALVDIPAESVVIKRGGAVLKSDEIYLEEYAGTNKKYTLFSEIFPGIATDGMIWASSDPEIAEVIPSESRKDSAEVVFKNYGSVDITCTSEKNSSITSRVTLYVGGEIPGYMQIASYDGSVYEEISLPRYGVSSLVAQVKPAKSVKSEKIEWVTSNAAVATVDDNGVVRAVGEGNCTVTASVSAKGKTIEKSVSVSVSGSSLLKEKYVYAFSDPFDVSPYLAYSGSEVEGGSLVSLSGVGSFEKKRVKVSYSGRTEELVLIKTDNAKTLVFENVSYLKEGALASFLALGTSNVRLKAIATDGSSPSVRYHSSAESVLRFDESGRLFAVGSGSAELWASAEGYTSERITVSVTAAVDDFRLSQSEYMDSVGLMQERVFGNRTYLDGRYEKSVTLSITSSSPQGASIEAFSFESANQDLAKVDAHGVVTFADDVDGKSVTITATAYNQEGMAVRKSYTFRLVNGVNVGTEFESAHFDREAGEKPDFSPYYDFKTVAESGEAQAIVLHCDIYYPARSEGGEAIKNCNVDLYGNGKKLDGQYFVQSVEDDEMLLLWDFESYTDMPEKLDVKLMNLNLQATQPTTEDSKATFEELNSKGGGAIGVKGKYPEGDHSASFTIKGCLFQYAYSHMNFAIGDFVIDGCIFRNNSASSIVLQQSTYGTANCKVKNCIFSNTIAPVGIVCGNFDDILTRFSGGSTERPKFGKFELEGQIYVYNWKKLDEVQMDLLPKNLENKNANALVSTFNGVLGKIIRESFMMSSKENLYTDADGVDWLNFSFLMIGIWENMNPYFNSSKAREDGLAVSFDPSKYLAKEVLAYRAPSIGSGLLKLATSFGVDLEKNKTYHIFCKDEKGKWNTLPGETYTIGKATYAKLNGQAA